MLVVGVAGVVALSAAFAQTSTKEASTTTSTSTLDGTGTISTYSPEADYIQLTSSSSTAPTKYYYSKSVSVVDPTGATVDRALLRSDLPVKYTYVKDGDRMVISKITVQKPLTEITKESTTTTTTTTK